MWGDAMTIFDYLERFAKERAHTVVFSDGEKYITYKDLYYIIANMQKMVSGFQNRTVLLRNTMLLEFVLAFLYLLSENCIVIPISNETTNSELDTMLSDVDYIDFDYGIMSEFLSISGYKNIDTVRIPDGEKAKIYHATSGSTGEAKLCIRTLENLTREGIAYKECLKIGINDKLISLCPLHHSYALGAALISTLVSGATLYLIQATSFRKIIRFIDQESITIVVLVPAIAKLMCQVKLKEKKTLHNVRVALAGAGIIDPELFNEFYETFGVYLQSNYGSTETGGILTRVSRATYPSLGQAMNGVKIKICFDDVCSKYGELYVKAEGMFQGYVNQNEEIFDSEGYFAMGDYVSKGIDGNIYYKGRKKNIINIGGKKINPLEVEEVIRKYAGVKECVVIEGRRKNNNVILIAIIVAEHKDSKGIYYHCINHLSSYKVPSFFHFLNKIPRNEVGKIKIESLKEMFKDI